MTNTASFFTVTVTFTNLTTNTSHTILVGGASVAVAHKNYLAACGQLLNPLFDVTSCEWAS